MTKLKLTNFSDVMGFREGRLSEDQIRSIEIDALVDSGAVDLVIPEDAADLIGAGLIGLRPVRFADGRVSELRFVGGFLAEILGRDYVASAYVTPRGTRALIGQIPLEALDLVVNPRNREVIPNPLHPDAPLIDILRVA